MSSASLLSKSLVFYYGSAMAIGVLLVVLMILFQVIKFYLLSSILIICLYHITFNEIMFLMGIEKWI